MPLKKPDWLRVKPAPKNSSEARVGKTLKELGLYTVCQGAHCPNRFECWGMGTATFMIMGRRCTRNCLFCAVESAKEGDALNEKEPENIAKAVREFGLKYVVLTSVDRDDLEDFGAAHYAKCIEAVKKTGAKVEALIPDFQGDGGAVAKVCSAVPFVIGHNLEVVKPLQKKARDKRASYSRSLEVLRKIKEIDKTIHTKSSLMLGLGETEDEVLEAMDDLRKADVDIMTIGQYLQPSPMHLEIKEYVHPDKFREYKKAALEKGFKAVFSGPFVRSSYRAAEVAESL